MKSYKYPENQALSEIYHKNNLQISPCENDYLGENQDYPALLFSEETKTYKIYVDNEYRDVQKANPLLNFYLILQSLDDFKDEPSYHSWCIAQGLTPSNPEVENYYNDLADIYNYIEELLGDMNTKISHLDFQLDSGPIQELRNFVK